MRKRALKPISEELIYFPLTNIRGKKNIELGVLASRSNRNKYSIAIRITKETKPSHISKFAYERGDIIKELVSLLGLDKSSVRRGRKPILPKFLIPAILKLGLKPTVVMNVVDSFKDPSWDDIKQRSTYKAIDQFLRSQKQTD